MYDFVFDEIEQDLELKTLKKGLFIWVWYADKIPPHIGVSLNGEYFSLKVSGVDVGIDIRHVSTLISKKQIPALAIEWNCDVSERKILRIFKNYDSARSNQSTCLSPLKDLAKDQSYQKLAELLVSQDSMNRIGIVYGLNLPTGYKGLLSYSVNEINQRLEQLEDAKR